MKKNKTKEMTDEITNMMTWFVAEDFSRTSSGKVLKPVLNILKAFQPKVDLLTQLATLYTENEEGGEKVEEKLEAEQQWEEEEELQQIKETIQVECSLYLGSPLASSIDSEQLRFMTFVTTTSTEWDSVDYQAFFQPQVSLTG
ncbi:hypothetical protein Y1Q_0012568 [Alligator mississippiensis]|uniref:Uncharacterized protein n=1 Tax=Alligator mississippiensis TaxID=8496 RepID=A0A151M839_ALLMI|nr:hypothetical protein Y1Q_0012568 [Alligator mississippiensis]